MTFPVPFRLCVCGHDTFTMDLRTPPTVIVSEETRLQNRGPDQTKAVVERAAAVTAWWCCGKCGCRVVAGVRVEQP